MSYDCEYGVQKFGNMTGPFWGPCGEQVVAEWSWVDGSSLRVCEEHDEALSDEEGRNEGARRMEVL